MKDEIQKITKWIVKNYEELPKSNIDGKELIIFATGNFSGEYGYGSSDLESWGVDKQGKLFWAYASGCSCNCNAGTDEKTLKMFEVEKVDTENTDIIAQIGLFNISKDKFKQSIQSYEYTSY